MTWRVPGPGTARRLRQGTQSRDLAVDFDKSNWVEDASASLGTCRRLDLDAALERSRSGRGGHVWLFFDEAIPSALARRLGSHILTETMEGRPDVGLDSY